VGDRSREGVRPRARVLVRLVLHQSRVRWLGATRMVGRRRGRRREDLRSGNGRSHRASGGGQDEGDGRGTHVGWDVGGDRLLGIVRRSLESTQIGLMRWLLKYWR
jgi:hypothetical protein